MITGEVGVGQSADFHISPGEWPCARCRYKPVCAAIVRIIMEKTAISCRGYIGTHCSGAVLPNVAQHVIS